MQLQQPLLLLLLLLLLLCCVLQLKASAAVEDLELMAALLQLCTVANAHSTILSPITVTTPSAACLPLPKRHLATAISP
jgi:hypothetical protein